MHADLTEMVPPTPVVLRPSRDDSHEIPRTALELRDEARRLSARYWRPVRPPAWRWRGWPMLVPFAIAVACAVLPLRIAVLPDFAPVDVFDLPQGVRDRAGLLWALCWIPALRYTLQSRGERRPIPFFPIIGVLYGLYYALAPALGYANYWGRDPVSNTAVTVLFDTSVDYGHPIDMALLGWIACLLARWAVVRWWRRPPPAIHRRLVRLTPRALIPWAFGFVGLNVALDIVHRITPFDPGRFGAFRIFTFLSHAAVVVLILAYRTKLLGRRQKVLAWGALLATLYTNFGGGATAPVLYTTFAIFVALWIGRRGLPARYIALGAVVIALCVSIRGVMEQWRLEVWWSGRTVPALEQSQILVRLLEESVRDRGVGGTVAHGWDVIARRSSNLELLADVMRRTPVDVPYWDGFTYQSLVGAFVPRLLWPDKPTKTLGQDFGHRYAYISPFDHSTSINLPVLIEFYINFGDAGIVLGMLLLGAIFGALEQLCNRPGQSVLVTAAAVPLLTQLFVMECDLSLQYGGLVMQLGVFLALGLGLVWLHDPRRRPPWWMIHPTLQTPRFG